MGREVPLTERVEFANKGEHGRVIVVLQDGPTIVLAPGEEASVWQYGGKFYRHRQTWWRRFARWWRETAAIFARRRT